MITIEPVDLRTYDVILISTSGGKDSSVAAWFTASLAEAIGIKDRLYLVHATFREEWEGTIDIVQQQAEQLGVPCSVVRRGENLLDYVRRRRMWPGLKNTRYCTSDFKRAPIAKVLTAKSPRHAIHRRWRVLMIDGRRADESRDRAKLGAFTAQARGSNGVRVVDEWRPIYHLSVRDVWSVIREHGIPQHEAYDLGMPRLSCRFCIFAPKAALILAGKHNRALLEEYAAVEREIGHSFRQDLKIGEVLEAVERGDDPGPVRSWEM